MKSGILISEGIGPRTRLPLPPSNQMLAIDLLVEMSNMSGLDLYPRWFPGNHTSSIWHPLFLLSTISLPVFSSSFCLIFRLCSRNLHISAFCKGSGSRKWSKCWCGPRPKPGKGREPWCCCGGNVPRQREGGFLRLQVWQRHSQFLWCFSEIYLFYISIIFSYLFG